jgi:hypothetical protein
MEEMDGDVVETSGQALEATRNSAGIASSHHITGAIDRVTPGFFSANGTNQRSCESCHFADQGWAITPAGQQRMFRESDGLSPLFTKTHDAGNRVEPTIDDGTATIDVRREVFSPTLLKKAVTRFGLAVPATAEFTAAVVRDPYGTSTAAAISFWRRPLGVTNETKVPNTNWTFRPSDFGQPDVPAFLAAIAVGASFFHLQAAAPIPPEVAAAVRDFQLGLFFAQSVDNEAGRLDAAGAKGGPENIVDQEFYIGINDMSGADPMGRPFSRKVFNLFDAWADEDECERGRGHGHHGKNHRRVAAARAAIYRGQELFNNYEFSASGVTGLNDVLGQDPAVVTCSTCHNTPNIGGHSVIRTFDIGTANEPNCSEDLVVFSLTNKTTGAVRNVCDAGRAGNSGLWVDVGGFRAVPLRGLAAHPPYFHDGQAKTVEATVRYYEHRFNFRLSHRQRHDLVAFLNAL